VAPRSPASILAFRLFWGLIPLTCAGLMTIGLLDEGKGNHALLGLAIGLCWLLATFLASRTRCPKCRKWFAGIVSSRLPATGHYQSGEHYAQAEMDVTYVCKFCGSFWIKRETGYRP